MLRTLGGIATAAMLASNASAQEVTLKLHQFLPAQANVPKLVLDVWADKVEADSDGRIKVDRFPSMQLGGSPPELMDQAIDGVADIVWTVVGYTPGQNHTEFEGAALYTLTFVLAMNKEKYDSLPDDLKAVVDNNSGLDFSIFAGGTQADADGPARELAVENGNNIVVVSDKSAWQEVVQPIYEQWITEMQDKGIDGQARIDQAKELMGGQCQGATAAY